MSIQSYAQNGSIEGKITDKETNNEPLPFANVLIKGTTKGTTTDFDGLYAIDGVEPGTYEVEFSFVGFETVTVPNVVVEPNKVTVINSALGATAAALDEVVVTVQTNREREEALLLEQKKAVVIKQSIGAQELARKGVGDVATAVTKITGISKQEGSSNVFVRGLGDRYNSTFLNGLPLPSNNPSFKNIQLDIFNTDVVETIDIDKTYSARNFGDFGGASIDIISKKYTGKGDLQVSFETGVNTVTITENEFFLTDGPNSSGFYDSNIPDFPLSAYNFDTSWDREATSVPINSGLSLTGGDSFSFSDDLQLRIFGTGSFNNQYSFREGVSRGGVTANSLATSDFDFLNYVYNTSTTLMGNATLRYKKNTFNYNVLFLNSSSEEQKEFSGIINIRDDASEGGGFIQRNVFTRTSLVTHQILGNHEIGERFEVDWGGSYNYILSSEPNRRQVTLLPTDTFEPDGPKSFTLVSAASDNHRFYADLEEDELAARISGTYSFGKDEEDEYSGKITLGYLGRMKTTDFQATQFNFRITPRVPQPTVDIRNVDAYFTQENLDNGLYSIVTFRGGADDGSSAIDPLEPQFYGGDQIINAGYIDLEYAFSDKLTVLAGVRAEQIFQSIEFSTAIAPIIPGNEEANENDLDLFELLPSLAVKYELNDKQNLKLAASKTYTLPQYKERAPFLYQEVNQDYQGNANLTTSTNYNFDAKWELYPSSGEIIAATLFGKIIQNPINEIVIQSASNDITWANTGDQATAFGIEAELKKEIFSSELEKQDITLERKLSMGLNAAYMITNQDLDGEKVLEETNLGFIPTYSETAISGASDLVANVDISYFSEFSENYNLQATLAGNYFSDRIFALGNFGRGNIIEKAVPTLDFILKSQLTKNIAIGFSAKNLLNPSIERFQEAVNDNGRNTDEVQDFQDVDVDILTYRRGLDVKLSLSYKF